MSILNCPFSFGNTGGACTPIFRDVQKLWFQRTKTSVSVDNGISLAATLNNALIQALVDQTDPTIRVFPLPQLWAADSERAESVKVTSPNKLTERVGQGMRTVTFEIWGKDATPFMAGQIESFNQDDFSFYAIDNEGNLRGSRRTTGYLKPIRAVASTLDVRYQQADAENPQKILVSFDVHPLERDKDLDMIASTSWAVGTDLGGFEGLVDIYATVTGISTIGATIELYSKYGTQLVPVRDGGRVVADFISSVTLATSKIRNQTDSADVTITSVTETATPGIYTLAWAAQTVGDVMIPFLTKTQRDYTNVKATTFVIV